MEKNELLNCHSCLYLSKRTGYRHFIYFCKKWNIESEQWIPFGTIKNALGKPCPFYCKKDMESSTENWRGEINITG